MNRRTVQRQLLRRKIRRGPLRSPVGLVFQVMLEHWQRETDREFRRIMYGEPGSIKPIGIINEPGTLLGLPLRTDPSLETPKIVFGEYESLKGDSNDGEEKA